LARPPQPIRLEPETGVEVIDGETRAVALPFWLRISPAESINRGRWVAIRYRSSFFDEPVRPLIRFVTASGEEHVRAMNGPVLGCGEWVGRVPERTVSIFVSPGRRLGPFSFRIDAVTRIPLAAMLWRALLNDWRFAYWSLRSRLVGSREEARQSVKYGAGGTSFAHYVEWHQGLMRPFDPDGLDRRPQKQASAAPVRLVMALGGAEKVALQATIAFLRAQVRAHWLLHADLDGAAATVAAAYRAEMQRDPRLLEIAPDSPCIADSSDLLAVISPGDTLVPYALALVADAFASNHDLMLAYSDEDAVTSRGDLHSPLLKPDWSPIFFDTVLYMGRLTCIRYSALAAADRQAIDLLRDEHATIAAVAAQAGRQRVAHIRRILYRRRRDDPSTCPVARRAPRPLDEWPEVSVVIPTRDRADLLAACVHDLRTVTDYPRLSVCIVDNESSEPKALALLEKLAALPSFQVLRRPGPFNFSQLSNEGARASAAPMLVFLNNDIRVIEAGWLKAMVRWAVQPHIGVVGAKLLFPNGRIQHAGVVLGMGGLAGHVYRQCAAKEPGYLDQLTAPREVTAVTAACIAVARSKFEAVSGFDAQNLPVDLNDMDLCLRIAEKGWSNLWTPEAVLTHLQSGTRGIDPDPFALYRKERAYFAKQWSEASRDDPYFHPGLSLFSQRPALG
jgi:GT2 family glycosyltransferase